MHKHVMGDIETLGTRPDAAIISIGAVVFDEEGMYDEFYTAVQPNTSTEAGLTVEQSTLDWWAKQSYEARAVFRDPNAATLRDAMLGLSHFIETKGGRDVRFWGNGAAFDNVILVNAFRVCQIPPPWMFYNDRCYRTIKSTFPEIKLQRIGTYHNALDDAKSQAQHLLDIHHKTPTFTLG